MRGNILAVTGDEVGQPVAGSRLKVIRFARGFLAYDPSAAIHQTSERLCIARGDPDFTDDDLARIKDRAGSAAAWCEGFERFGRGFPGRVRGRFSVMLFRLAEGDIVAATDRFGTWPVCFAKRAAGLVLGERADDVAGGKSSLSVQALFTYLFFHVIPSPRTIFEDVSRLPPAHTLEWSAGKLDCRRYWQPVFRDKPRTSMAASKAEFLEIVEHAVAREAASGDVGAYLSGGTDSSTVAGMLGRVTGQPAETYSIGFDAAGYDEMEYARIAARHFGTRHHEYYVTPEDLIEGIPKVATHYDQPFGNSSAVPAWLCAARARADGVGKMLAGDGGDELFAGNTRYLKQRVFRWYRLFPGIVRRHLIEPIARQPAVERLPLGRKAASYVRQARVPMPDRLQTYNMLLRLGADTVLNPAFLAAVDRNDPFDMQRRHWDQIDAGSELNDMLAFDWKFTLADNDLPKVLGTADLAGIDVPPVVR